MSLIVNNLIHDKLFINDILLATTINTNEINNNIHDTLVIIDILLATTENGNNIKAVQNIIR